MIESDVLASLSPQERAQLEENHFDREAFVDLRRRYLSGALSVEDNRVVGTVEAPAREELAELPERDGAQGRRLCELGKAALERGEVGAVILNGGMATRFGGVVKGCVEVYDGLSFLGLKLLDARSQGPNLPVLLMNSFATYDKTREHLEAHNYFGFDPSRLIPFRQNISVRLTPEGEIFRNEDGGASFYAPGHGDLPSAIGRGPLQAFREGGGKYLLMSNVDNVLASLDPLVVGKHIEAAQAGVEMTVETVQKDLGDVGGMPARVDGHLQVVEAFRFPRGFDLDAIPVFNTNTFVFNAESLDREFDLTWYMVEKAVDGRPAIQFERLAGELSAYLDTQFLVVPRRGDESRFLPIKTREDLDLNRDFLRQRTQAR